MISLLRISGFALIDELELALGPGLTVLTGETGAGKSIVVDALALLRGGRASVDAIRTGRDEARVEAAIELPADAPVRARLRAEGRDGDGELLVRRAIARSGRGRIHVGGALATVGDLAATVGGLVDIASQHDQQTLTDPEQQLAILDDFASNRPLRDEMAAAYAHLQASRAELERFDADARTRAAREDLLRYQLSELESARLEDPNEDERLKAERERLRGAEKFQAAVARGEEVLYAAEDAVAGRIASVIRELGPLASLDPTLAPFVERLREAAAQVEDVARDLSRYGESVRSDPARLAEVEERLFLMSRLARKHGGTLADVIARAASMQRDLAEIGSFEEGLAERRAAVATAEGRAGAAAAQLSESRQRAALGLEERVNAVLGELALGAARLPISVEARDVLSASGGERVRFLFAPNPGEPPRPLAKIASGGELSRVMLAMKQALSRSDQVLTYVFDEVDAGVGGATAEAIGRKLKVLAADRQVLVITHLPQIAVFAETHFRVTKHVKAGADRTVVSIDRLGDKERVAEVTRMLSGAATSRQATAHADEMLRRARVITRLVPPEFPPEARSPLTAARHRVTERGAVSPTCPSAEVAETPAPQVQNALSPRRKRRSAEVRNSLRLFGLLAVLAGVNVYVFFFNHGTAPRDVLKASSTAKAADGKAGTLKEAAQVATADLSATASPQMVVPAGGAAGQAAAASKKSMVPRLVAPAATPSPAARSKGGLAATSHPKAPPGGSPGVDDEGSLNPEKKIGDAETLGQILVREGFEGESPKIVAALSRLFDAKLIRGGQSYLVRADEGGEPESFEYRPNAVTRYVVSRGASGTWVATRVDQPVETKVVTVAGNIDSSLYESVQKAQEGSALAGLLVELLAWDVNFYTDTHPGDHWKVIVEKQYLGGQFYRYGRILAAEYGGRVGMYRAFYWKANRPNAEGRYFDEKGQAISKTLLKTPLRFVRISSKFDRHRFHPILHVEKAHLGIDYAAPVGTPVWASAAGKVVECEMKRGSGNTVVLAHPNGLTTRYYHLSRFARGMKAGKLVKQKDVIGFVGTTGLSTGPHLHFSVTKNGAFVDPSKVQVNRDAPVSEPGAYLAAIRPRIATLRALDPTALARN